MDGIILLQIMLFMLMMRKRNNFNRHNGNSQIKKMILIAILINSVILGVLYLFEEITFCFCILAGEVGIAIAGFILGYAIIYSVETWF